MPVDAEYLVLLERHRLKQRLSPLLGRLETEVPPTRETIAAVVDEIHRLLRP